VSGCSRRCVILGGAALAACGPSESRVDAGPGESPGAGQLDAGFACSTEDPGADWVRLELAEFPALNSPGGTAIVERSKSLLNVWVNHQSNGCYSAVWRVCTHGACDVEPWNEAEYRCPCHDSRFALDGSIIQGPARRALRSFVVVRRGDTLFLKR